MLEVRSKKLELRFEKLVLVYKKRFLACNICAYAHPAELFTAYSTQRIIVLSRKEKFSVKPFSKGLQGYGDRVPENTACAPKKVN